MTNATNTGTTPATPTDFARWTEAAAAMSVDQLRYTIRDCADAAWAVEEHDPIKACRYRDESLVCQQELATRASL